MNVPTFLDRKKLVGTYSILNSYRNCPHQMGRRYVVKDLGPYVETPEIAWGNKVHLAMEQRVQGGKPLPVEMQGWEVFAAPLAAHEAGVRCELKLGVTQDFLPCDFWAEDVWFRGKLDVAMIKGPNAYIVDWKTGKSTYEDPLELETGAALLRAKFSHIEKITGNYVWLKENRLGERYDLSDTRQTWSTVQRLMDEIAAKVKSTDPVWDVWEKQPSGLCSWCPVKDCEHWRERK